MLFYNIQYVCYGFLPFLLLAMACAGYAYHVDAQRPADDPQKRNYHPLGIVFAPITIPIFVIGSISIFVLKVLLYGVFLILFPVVLIVARKPFLLQWLARKATAIGNKLLDTHSADQAIPEAQGKSTENKKVPLSRGFFSRRFI